MNIKIFLKSSIQIAVTFFTSWACAIESEEMAMQLLKKLIGITENYKFRTFSRVRLKKNRSRIDSFSGIGDEKALKFLEKYLILEFRP
jgi:2-dehydro-3-deoxyphosphooctonate aldolase (KDO 8-P synthase)